MKILKAEEGKIY
jgi:hypothetical protein